MRENTAHVGRRDYLRAAGSLSAIAALAGCTGGDGDGDGGGEPTPTPTATSMPEMGDVVIGNAAPLTGNITPWGQLHRAGLEYAAEVLNGDGGVMGRDVRIANQDTEANPQNAASAFRRLVNNEDAAAVTGPVLSNVAIRCRQVAEEIQVPLLPNQGASANLLTKESRYTFRVAGAATPWFARATAGFIEDNGWTKYGAIIADYAYGHSYQEAMERFITSMSGLDSTVRVAPIGAQDFTSHLRQMPDDLEFLDIGGHPIGIFTIVQQTRELGLEPAAMSGPNIPTPLFFEVLGEAVESAGITLFPPVDTTSADYVDVASQFHDATGEFFDPYVAFGYVTVNLVAAAIEESGDASAQGIRDGLSDVSYDSILAIPSIEYNEWGELQTTKLIGQQFTLEAPSYYPDGSYSFRNVYETEEFPPVDPTNWG